MSEIFDALQRSESGDAKAEPKSPLRPFEVLQRAEHLAQTKWEHTDSATLPVRSGEVAELETMLKNGVLTSNSAVQEENAPADSSSGALDRISDAGQFPSISVSLAPDSKLVCVADPDAPASEAFRLLGVRLRDLREVRPLKRILVTSTVPQEGKTTVAGNLACTIARSSRTRTLLLEGDIRRPAQSKMLGLKPDTPGLCEWLQSKCSLTQSIHYVDPLGFWIMPAGVYPANPLEILLPARLSALMRQLGEWFDQIIIDSPPVLPLADTSMWMKFSDGILLVTRQGITEKRPLQRGLEAIDPQKLIGMILNSSKNLPHTDYYYSTNPSTKPSVRS